jgi:hypothetical protein
MLPDSGQSRTYAGFQNRDENLMNIALKTGKKRRLREKFGESCRGLPTGKHFDA